MAQPHVIVLGTGGTIASRHDPETGATRIVASGEELVEAIPALSAVANVEVETVFTRASFCLTPDDVLVLAGAVRQHLTRNEVAGVVITHGTDTMEESAFLLDLLIDAAAKPVVFTGAQLSGDMDGADGPRNLINAVRVAADPAARGIGVVLAFADSVFAARDVTKAHTSRLEPFVSTRGARRGQISRDAVQVFGPATPRPTYAIDHLVTDVALIHLAMGMGADFFEHALARGARGIVLAAFGIGNANPEIVACVEQATARGVPVVVTSRCGAGRVAPIYAHGGGRDLEAAGAIFAGDLACEKARLALMVLLARGNDLAGIRDEMALVAT